MEQIRVKIRNHEYLILSEDDQGHVNEIAEYVNKKLKEVEESEEGLSEKKVAILGALNIASDYFRVLKERDEILDKIRQRTKTLIYNIDSVINE